MTLSKIIAATASVLVTLPIAAQTADSWTGFYVGAHGSYAWQRMNKSESILFDTNLDNVYADTVRTAAGANAFSPGFCSGSANGPAVGGGCRANGNHSEYGVHVGYDYQRDDSGAVAGVVLDYDHSGLRDSVTGFSTTPAFYTLTRELENVYTLRVRGGIARGNTLFYGTGGFSYGEVRNSFTTSNTVNGFADNGNEPGRGFVLGGGVEQRFGQKFSVGLQYLYRDLRADDQRVLAGPGSAGLTNAFRIGNSAGTNFERSDIRVQSHIATVTANFRF